MKALKSVFLATDFIVLLAAELLMCAASFLVSVSMGIYVLIAAAAVAVSYYIACVLGRRRRARAALAAVMGLKYRPGLEGIFAALPAALALNDVVQWSNAAFAALTDAFIIGRNIRDLVPSLSSPDSSGRVYIGGNAYTVRKTTVGQGRPYTLYCFERFGFIAEDKFERARMGVVCHIRIDNYDRLISDLKLTEQTMVLGEAYSRISAYADKASALMVQYEKDRFLTVFERRMLTGLADEKFSLLDSIRQIKTSAGYPVTVSIAVGEGETLKQSGEFALKALDMAQGRGGDQAVVRQGDSYAFFGGSERDVERNSQVKTRLMAKTLCQLMERCSDVFVMGHDVADLDSFGASLGIVACARSAGKKAHVVLDRPNTNVTPIISVIKSYKEYQGVIVGSDEAALIMKDDSLLVVVDTQIASNLEAPGLLKRASTLAIIDHHLRGTNQIKNAQFYCHEPYASSTCEMVAELIRYFGEGGTLLPIEAEALLAGITVDTKGFSFKTGVRTFEAASYLRRCGADTMSIRQLFQDDLETFKRRTEVVRAAKLIIGNVAVSRVPSGTVNGALIAAQAADLLLTIRGISASFVLFAADDAVTISGRSLGTVNVQLILERLGGGGHAGMAGAKIKNSTLDDVYVKLLDTIEAYMKEGKK